jgi:hypothetical protein
MTYFLSRDIDLRGFVGLWVTLSKYLRVYFQIMTSFLVKREPLKLLGTEFAPNTMRSVDCVAAAVMWLQTLWIGSKINKK